MKLDGSNDPSGIRREYRQNAKRNSNQDAGDELKVYKNKILRKWKTRSDGKLSIYVSD